MSYRITQLINGIKYKYRIEYKIELHLCLGSKRPALTASLSWQQKTVIFAGHKVFPAPLPNFNLKHMVKWWVNCICRRGKGCRSLRMLIFCSFFLFPLTSIGAANHTDSLIPGLLHSNCVTSLLYVDKYMIKKSWRGQFLQCFNTWQLLPKLLFLH